LIEEPRCKLWGILRINYIRQEKAKIEAAAPRTPSSSSVACCRFPGFFPRTREKRRVVMMTGVRVGEVTHFFGKINVAVVELEKELKVGDKVHFLGRHTDFQQEVDSMQVEHEAILVGEAGSEVAVKTTQRVRRGDSVFLLNPEE
jgi:hypothetical protein